MDQSSVELVVDAVYTTVAVEEDINEFALERSTTARRYDGGIEAFFSADTSGKDLVCMSHIQPMRGDTFSHYTFICIETKIYKLTMQSKLQWTRVQPRERTNN